MSPADGVATASLSSGHMKERLEEGDSARILVQSWGGPGGTTVKDAAVSQGHSGEPAGVPGRSRLQPGRVVD